MFCIAFHVTRALRVQQIYDQYSRELINVPPYVVRQVNRLASLGTVPETELFPVAPFHTRLQFPRINI